MDDRGSTSRGGGRGGRPPTAGGGEHGAAGGPGRGRGRGARTASERGGGATTEEGASRGTREGAGRGELRGKPEQADEGTAARGDARARRRGGAKGGGGDGGSKKSAAPGGGRREQPTDPAQRLLTVKVSGDERVLRVTVARTLSIAALKGVLLQHWEQRVGGEGRRSEALHAAAQKMRLIYAGRQLDADKGMEDYGLHAGAGDLTIHMVLPSPLEAPVVAGTPGAVAETGREGAEGAPAGEEAGAPACEVSREGAGVTSAPGAGVAGESGSQGTTSGPAASADGHGGDGVGARGEGRGKGRKARQQGGQEAAGGGGADGGAVRIGCEAKHYPSGQWVHAERGVRGVSVYL